MNHPVAISVIVTTYCEPDSLGLVLQALTRQTRLPDEVLVADDGSAPEQTLDVMRTVAAAAPFSLVHVWQPDNGFRAARSRNNAIHHARGRFLAFLDQDTLPHPFWLATHHDAVTALQIGLGHLLERDAAHDAAVVTRLIESGDFNSLHSPDEWRVLHALHAKYRMYALLRRLRLAPAHKPKLRSCNFSVHHSALETVNGFDERYEGWGQEDDDLGRRLYRAGMRPVILLTHAPVSHRRHALRHDTDWRNGSNQVLYHQWSGRARCEQGLDRHPHTDVVVTRL